MISIPFWTMATKKFGKRKTYKVSILLYVVINLFFLLPGEGFPILAFYGMVIALGIPFGCILMLPFAMVTDIIQFEKQKTGNDNDGVFTGVWTATEKTGFAIGPLVAGVALSAVGFVESDGGQVTQSAETILGIKLAFSIIPSLLVGLSFFCLKYYNISSSDLVKNSRE
jgi:GPH family glycoside/pentoside/hexuronide:cation symporter